MKRIVLITAVILFCLTGCSQNKSNSELLEGTWQSMDDETNFLVFENGMRKEIAEGMENWDIEAYTLSDFCTNDTDKNSGLDREKERYISCSESDLCWYIIQLDEENLVLSSMGRGNTLTYKRVKNRNVAAASNNNCEDFSTFLNSYNNDLEFQKNRTIFPFINESYDYDEVMNDEGDYEPRQITIITEIKRNDWEKMDFTWDPSDAERKTDAYIREIETRGDTTFIYYKGVGNGINIQAIFLCKDKQWYLQKMIDRSM